MLTMVLASDLSIAWVITCDYCLLACLLGGMTSPLRLRLAPWIRVSLAPKVSTVGWVTDGSGPKSYYSPSAYMCDSDEIGRIELSLS